MTLSSRHMTQNSSSGGLRPSTLSLGDGGSPQYRFFMSERGRNIFVSLKLECQSGGRTRYLRLPKQATLNTAPRAPALMWQEKGDNSWRVSRRAKILSLNHQLTVDNSCVIVIFEQIICSVMSVECCFLLSHILPCLLLWCRHPSNTNATQCCCNVGPASQTMVQHYSSIGLMFRVGWTVTSSSGSVTVVGGQLEFLLT